MSKKVFVLRTHALISVKESTLRFGDDNDIVIPLCVLDEIRRIKNVSFEKSRIASNLLDYVNSFSISELTSKKGAKQKNGSYLRLVSGFEDTEIKIEGISYPEKRTLQVCLGLLKEEHNENVILVTNNKSLQIKAKMLGIKAESFKDEVFPKSSEQYKGREEVFTRDDVIDNFFSNGSIKPEDIFEYHNIEFVENKFFLIKSVSNKSALGIYRNGLIYNLVINVHPYSVKPKNIGQRFMLEALLRTEFPLVVIKGSAGTGKTFCTLAAGLAQIDAEIYSRILVTRSVTATEQYGFLPGDIESKLAPYLAGIKDNLSILLNSSTAKARKDDRAYEDGQYFFEKGIVQIQAIGFLRGRSIVDTFFIIDETQNIDPETIKSIVTRAGEGSKFIFLGDPTQIDNPNLNERNNGLVYLSEKMKGNPLCVQVTLSDEESVRSELAKNAAQIL